ALLPSPCPSDCRPASRRRRTGPWIGRRASAEAPLPGTALALADRSFAISPHSPFRLWRSYTPITTTHPTATQFHAPAYRPQHLSPELHSREHREVAIALEFSGLESQMKMERRQRTARNGWHGWRREFAASRDHPQPWLGT